MAGPLPHSATIQSEADAFIDEVVSATLDASKKLKKSPEFRWIYRTSLATDAVLSKLLRHSKRPPPFGVRSSVRRIPLLICSLQVVAAGIELRRFLELVAWDIYFAEHPIEWERFKATPGQGYSKDDKDPIAFCAHRELDFYLNYAKSRLQFEPSQISVQALTKLKLLKGQLNESVHPGLAVHMGGSVVPLDSIDSLTLTAFQKRQRAVFSNACIVTAGVRRRLFDSLPAMHRAHFDWLVGADVQKKIRSGPFGV
jgi:hypothetical protein